MDTGAIGTSDFSLTQIRGILKDLFVPKAWIYWTDLLASMTLGGVSFALVRRAPLPGALFVALFAVSCVCFYRAALFTHELVHMRAGSFRSFRFAWNLLCGIPFLIPTFTYYTHVDHHMRSHFGTDHDGEYIPFASRRPGAILIYLLQPFVIPPLVVARFLLLTPLCWASPRLRQWAHARASSMVMEPTYIRPTPTAKTLRVFRVQEAACFLLLLGGAIRLAMGKMPIGFLAQSYCTAVGVLLLNNLRTLGAHRYTSGGKETTFVEQLLDSINYPNFSLLTPLWAPVGLRYHALHHLCPSLPYHNMAEAHRRLMRELPADSPYRKTNCPSLWAAIRALWGRAEAGSGVSRGPVDPEARGDAAPKRGAIAISGAR